MRISERFATLLVFLLPIGVKADPINLRDNFFADSSVVFSDDGVTATLVEDSALFVVLLSNHPGLGEPALLIPGPAATMMFDYAFVEGPVPNNDEFGAFVLDPSTGDSLGPPLEFFTQDSSAGTITFDLSSLAEMGSVGLQFQLGALAGDLAFESTVEITNVRFDGPPVATCRDVTVSANANCRGVVTAQDVNDGSEDPDDDPISLSLSPAGPYPLGPNTVTLTVTDGEGLADSCMATVTVVDDAAPTITCVPNITVECTVPDGAVVSFEPTAADNCDLDVAVTCFPVSGSTFELGTTPVTCTATDDFGNSSSCAFTVTVQDTTNPTVVCPDDKSDVECASPAGTVVNFTLLPEDGCDPMPMATADPASGSTFPIGTTTVDVTATDASGNNASCSFEITVRDTVAPIISCPPDATVECSADASAAALGEATGTDVCGDVTISHVDSTTDTACWGGETTIIRTWTATDLSGNSSSCDQVITRVDTTPPEIECNAPETIVPPDAPISFTATATDNCCLESVEITEFDCFFINPAGKRVDKTNSCEIELNGATITILDSGGVGDMIAWTARAIDCCGRESTLECQVEVVNPGAGRRALLGLGESGSFLRGDSNGDRVVDLSDPLFSLNYLFAAGAFPPCQDAADVNDDGRMNIADISFALAFLFYDGRTPPEPYPESGFDPTSDSLDCRREETSDLGG